MAEIGRELSQKQRRALAALLTSKSVAEAATLSGQGERTIYRWLADPVFHDALVEAEGRLIDDASRRLLQLQGAALDTLEALLATDAPGATDSIKLRAAQLALDHLLKLREMRDMEKRLQALEEMFAMNGGQA